MSLNKQYYYLLIMLSMNKYNILQKLYSICRSLGNCHHRQVLYIHACKLPVTVLKSHLVLFALPVQLVVSWPIYSLLTTPPLKRNV